MIVKNEWEDYLHALADPRTYDPRNRGLWLGFLWGLPVPAFSLALDVGFGGGEGRGIFTAIRDHPIHWFFLLHPLMFAVLFGAAGIVHREHDDLIERLGDEATHDPLTGLFNRRYVLEALSKSLARAERADCPLTLVLFDLDQFKAVNDRRGHQEGDRVLREAARGLVEVVRHGDILGRYGGDEFLLVLPNGLPDLAEFTARASEAARVRSGISISAGASHWPEDGRTAEELLRGADLALAIAKRAHHERQSLARR